MLKALKILRIVAVVVVVLIIAVVILVNVFADRAVKMGIEIAGSDVLGVKVKVDRTDLKILGGSLEFSDLVIDNPRQYQNEKFLELANARIAVDVRSLLTDVVNIKEIKLDGIELVFEQKGITGNNLQDILKNLPSGDEEKPESKAEPSGKKLHIDELEILNVTVKVKLLPIPGRADTVPLKLKPIKMTDLGSDDKLDTAALIGKILVALAAGIAEQGVGVIPDEILNPLKDQLGNLGALLGAGLKGGGKLIEGGVDLTKGVLEGGKDAGKGITEGIGGLFKKKKEGE
jgi:hypothetical protein